MAFKDEQADLGSGGLLVEAFSADEQLQGIGWRDVIALSTNAAIELEPLLDQAASLEVSLADGRRARFSGHVSEVEMLGGEGGESARRPMNFGRRRSGDAVFLPLCPKLI